MRQVPAQHALRLLLVAVTLLTAAGVAHASEPPTPTLEGEALISDFGSFDPNVTDCNPGGTSTLSFTVSGVASGPYPGRFDESATVSIGPQTEPGELTRGINAGTVVAFDSTFAITSGVTIITGTKHLSAIGAGPFFNHLFTRAVCASFDNHDFDQLVAASGHYIEFALVASYEATIDTGAALISDDGAAATYGQEIWATTADGFGIGANGFIERFFEPPTTVTLSPPDAVNYVDTDHALTATVNSGDAVRGGTVLFSVRGVDTADGSCTTDDNGQCSFTYHGPQLPGADLITACLDRNGNGIGDPEDACGTATKAWTLPSSTPGQVTGGGQVLNAAGADQIAFGFTAKSQSDVIGGTCTIVDPSTNTTLKCLDVTALVQSDSHATFFGHGTLNNVPMMYRIDVDDFGEPGSGRDVFKVEADAGFAVAGVVSRGNIQIHK
jgi:hypothetical protein